MVLLLTSLPERRLTKSLRLVKGPFFSLWATKLSITGLPMPFIAESAYRMAPL